MTGCFCTHTNVKETTVKLLGLCKLYGRALHRGKSIKLSQTGGMDANLGQHNGIRMWQSRVEIEHYSVTHFYRITAFKVL